MLENVLKTKSKKYPYENILQKIAKERAGTDVKQTESNNTIKKIEKGLE